MKTICALTWFVFFSLGVPGVWGADFSVEVPWAYYRDDATMVDCDFSKAVLAADGSIAVSPGDVTMASSQEAVAFQWFPQFDAGELRATLEGGSCRFSVPWATEVLPTIPTANIRADGAVADWATVAPYLEDEKADQYFGAPGVGADIETIQLAYSPDGARLHFLWKLAAPADGRLIYRLDLDRDLDGRAAGTGDYQIDVQRIGWTWKTASRVWRSGDPCDSHPVKDGGVVFVAGPYIEASVEAAAFGLPAHVNVFGCSRRLEVVPHAGAVCDWASHQFHRTGGSCVLDTLKPTQAPQPKLWYSIARFSGFRSAALGQETAYVRVAGVSLAGVSWGGADPAPWVRADWLRGHYRGEDFRNALFLSAGIEGRDYQWSSAYDNEGGLLLFESDPNATTIPDFGSGFAGRLQGVARLDPNTTTLDLQICVEDSGRKIGFYYRLNSREPNDGWYLIVAQHTLPAQAAPLKGFPDIRPALGLHTYNSYGEPVPVYRFWSNVSAKHFYTADPQEKKTLAEAHSDIWTLEQVAYYAHADDGDPNRAPVHRFWSSVLGSHFYTISTAEKDKLLGKYSDVWTYEGVAFYAYPQGAQPPGASPVHRFWSDERKCHFYTISEDEKTTLAEKYADVWTHEGIAWYALPIGTSDLPPGPYPTSSATCSGPTCKVTSCATCRGLPTCNTTCVGPTCNSTCAGRATCGDRATCSATCWFLPTCHDPKCPTYSPTCAGRPTCNAPTCSATCAGQATCNNRVTCGGPTCSGATCSSTCPVTCYPTVGYVTCTCMPAGRCRNQYYGSDSQEANRSTKGPLDQVVYSLQKDWLITDWTCPALDVDCPTVVPDAVGTSGESQRARDPQASIRIAAATHTAKSSSELGITRLPARFEPRRRPRSASRWAR